MIPKPHNPRINDPVRVLGINFYDLAITGGIMMLVIIILGAVNVYTDVMGPWTLLCILLIFIGVVFVLKFANKQNHPQFLMAWMSYTFFQPKKITFRNQTPGKKTL